MKKRPCKVCRRWFRPNPRVGDAQMTCGRPECKREWHRKKCAEWNRKNREYFKEIYLNNKILAASAKSENPVNQQKVKGKSTRTRFNVGLPWQQIQEVMGVKQLVIIEYIIHLLLRAFKEPIKAQAIVNTG
jgi:hypothetical protein